MKSSDTKSRTRCAVFSRRCRQAGLRVTHQRLAIYDVLAQCRNHPDAEEVHARVLRFDPMLSLNTVYRTLGMLVTRGLVMRVASVGNAARFDACVEPHDHFYCNACDRVIDIPGAPSARPEPPEGMDAIGAVMQTQTLFVGLCRQCRGRKS